MSTTHEVKCWPEHFRQLQNAERTFDVRLNDRDYQDGDLIVQQEFEPETVATALITEEGALAASLVSQHPNGRYTGNSLRFRINRVFRDHIGLQPDHVALSLGAVMER